MVVAIFIFLEWFDVSQMQEEQKKREGKKNIEIGYICRKYERKRLETHFMFVLDFPRICVIFYDSKF